MLFQHSVKNSVILFLHILITFPLILFFSLKVSSSFFSGKKDQEQEFWENIARNLNKYQFLLKLYFNWRYYNVRQYFKNIFGSFSLRYLESWFFVHIYLFYLFFVTKSFSNIHYRVFTQFMLLFWDAQLNNDTLFAWKRIVKKMVIYRLRNNHIENLFIYLLIF